MKLANHLIYVQTLAVLLILSPSILLSQEPTVPYPKALQYADISVDRLDNIIEYALIVGNGDINALVYAQGGQVQMMLTKNDVWDARIDSKLDPPIPTLDLIKKQAGQFPKNEILPEGSNWKGPDSYSAHPYPCPRACAALTLVNMPAQPRKDNTLCGRLDLRRAVANVLDKPGGKPIAQIRALADRNVFLIRSSLAGQIDAVKSADIPAATSGEADGVRWITQQIPGDVDWPGMSFAVAKATSGDLTAVAIVTSLEADDPKARAITLAHDAAASDVTKSIERHDVIWNKFWSRSGIEIDQRDLSDIWYRNLYFLRCTSKPGVVSPGLFASLTSDKPAWHGDYHTNYNIQQTFWGAFAANQAELTEPYDRLISQYMPRARWLCRRIFSIDGVYIPHVLYAYEPDPEKCKSPGGRQYIHHVWGFTLGVNGFSVQPLWWHYKYAPDREFLKNVAYPAVRDVAVFQANFIDLCEGDETVVLAPTVSPEHWGWTKNFHHNRNGTFDIALFQYIFEAAIEGATTLNCDAELVARWQKAAKRLPAYPTTKTAPPIVVDVQDAPPITYNIAVPAVPVFPGDVVTWFSPEPEKDLFRRTIKDLKWNGNNAAVCLAIARVRLSMPDALEWTKNELTARRRSNGTLTMNRIGQSPFNDFGHYTETFGATMAISELLIQSVGDIIRLFPAWPKDRDASFTDLRAQGGFLVSAEQKGGKLRKVAVRSTVGGRLQWLCPWGEVSVVRNGAKPTTLKPDAHGIIRLDTKASEQLIFHAIASSR
ncbi:MAG: hypothetical protein JXM70_05680 [Pirellulales bacterium]|nr:hypothetical protein [Pirellulales bacterium]